MSYTALRQIVGLWLVWLVIVIGFQTLVQERLQPYRPDKATEWTDKETARNSQKDKIYLNEPFMNNQVSWDGEFYMAIATGGYDDPGIRPVDMPDGRQYSMSYAFFPLYPVFMSVVRVPFLWLGLTPLAASAIAGVVVAALGTLAAMVGLFDIAQRRMGEEGALRTVFFMLIFPTGFFLAQVYTEGLFLGLAFGSLALMERKQWFWAALLAAFATLTRSVGIFLLMPLGIAWLLHLRKFGSIRAIPLRVWLSGAALTLPLVAYGLWRLALGTPFDLVQTNWFGRGALDFQGLAWGAEKAWAAILSGENSHMRVYFLLEFASVILAAVACLFTLRRYPLVTLFGAAALFISVTSGSPQSLIRYVLAVPPVFLMLGTLGKNKTFEQGWTIASLLLMGLQVSLFTWDMWVA